MPSLAREQDVEYLRTLSDLELDRGKERAYPIPYDLHSDAHEKKRGEPNNHRRSCLTQQPGQPISEAIADEYTCRDHGHGHDCGDYNPRVHPIVIGGIRP